MAEAALLLGAYLIGSLPFSYWTVRVVRGIDVRTVGSRSAGATNVLRSAGRGPAIVALLLDTAKGAAAVLVARAAGGAPWVLGAAALLVVVGHVFPLFLGFRGGKGVASAAGALASLAPGVFLVMLAVFASVVAVSRFVSLGSIVASSSFPVALWIGLRAGWVDDRLAPILPWCVGVAAVIVLKHHANIRRLLAGTENRLGGAPTA